jgi:hypothetical protein
MWMVIVVFRILGTIFNRSRRTSLSSLSALSRVVFEPYHGKDLERSFWEPQILPREIVVELTLHRKLELYDL